MERLTTQIEGGTKLNNWKDVLAGLDSGQVFEVLNESAKLTQWEELSDLGRAALLVIALNRLSAYEDSGFTPEQCQGLAAKLVHRAAYIGAAQAVKRVCERMLKEELSRADQETFLGAMIRDLDSVLALLTQKE